MMQKLRYDFIRAHAGNNVSWCVSGGGWVRTMYIFGDVMFRLCRIYDMHISFAIHVLCVCMWLSLCACTETANARMFTITQSCVKWDLGFLCAH